MAGPAAKIKPVRAEEAASRAATGPSLRLAQSPETLREIGLEVVGIFEADVKS
jgi:hypothetical protein